MDELGRRSRGHVGEDRPPVVVQLELRAYCAQVHVRVEVGVDRPHVSPVAPIALLSAGHLVLQEVVDVRRVVPDQPGDDVPAHAVPALAVDRVFPQHVHQHVGIEHVDAHGCQGLVRQARAAGRVGGLLQELLDAVAIRRGLQHAEVRRRQPGDGDRRDRGPSARGRVLVDHLYRVHPVHMIGPEDGHEVGRVALDDVQRLVDRVCRAGLPVRAEPLLRRDRRHVATQQVAQLPGGGDVPVQAVALVLREHVDPMDAAVDQIGHREIDQPVRAAERNG